MRPISAAVNTVAVIYNGPQGQQCALLARHGHPAVCEPGRSYDLPEDVAERLARSSRWFRVVRPAKPAPVPVRRRASRKARVMAPTPAAQPTTEETDL